MQNINGVLVTNEDESGRWGDLGMASYIEKNKKGLGTTIFKIYTAKDGKYHTYDKNTGVTPIITIKWKRN